MLNQVRSMLHISVENAIFKETIHDDGLLIASYHQDNPDIAVAQHISDLRIYMHMQTGSSHL